jgi:hypothetical protein
MKHPALRALCRFLSRPIVLIIVGLLVLLLLWLLRDWLAFLLVVYLVTVFLFGLVVLALFAARVLAKVCRKLAASPKGYGSVGHPGSTSVKIPSHTYKRPDPTIYCQSYLMAKGLAVTWDNPDIRLSLGGVPAFSHDLAPATKYKVEARIWNNSTEAPAVNLLVRFYYLSFGIGVVRNYIDETFVDLPVKGAPGHPAVAATVWETPATPGHYCLQAELVWPDDANPNNNLGQENVNVKKLNSPHASFAFPLRNDSPSARTLRLTADSYAIPPLPRCDPVEVPAGRDAEIGRAIQHNERLARHRHDVHPVPAGWRIEFQPAAELRMEPGETRLVTVDITATDAPVIRQAVNVNAHAEDGLVGGVTLYVHS